jgi:hypothetical protein
VQLQPSIKAWVLRSSRPDPYGIEAAQRRRVLTYLEALDEADLPQAFDRLAKQTFATRALGGPGSGDLEGHEFHGNQWTEGSGAWNSKERPRYGRKEKPFGSKAEVLTEIKAQTKTKKLSKDIVLPHHTNDKKFVISTKKTRLIPNSGSLGLGGWAFGTKRIDVTLKAGTKVLDVSPRLWHALYQLRPTGEGERPVDTGARLFQHAKSVGVQVIRLPDSITGVGTEWAVIDASAVKKQVRVLGGPGSGDVEGHEFHGNQWTGGLGGGSQAARYADPYTPAERHAFADKLFTKQDRPSNAALDAEAARQTERALAQQDDMAHQRFILGMDNALGNEVARYVAAYGERFPSQPLPADVEPGTPKQCYRNASLLVMERPDLTYVEGYARSPQTGGLVFMHAWAVDRAGKVIDPTWEHPEQAEYFGVKYDRAKYLKSLYKTEVYGVVGGTFQHAQKAILTGGLGMRSTQ